MSSAEVSTTNIENVQKKKDVIDEAIERIQVKLKQLKTQKKIAQQDAEEERKRRFKERLKTFSSVESSTIHPPRVNRSDTQNNTSKDENPSKEEQNNGFNVGRRFSLRRNDDS